MRGTEYDPLRFLRIFAFSFGFLLLFSSSFYLSLPSFYISLLFSFFLRSFLLFFSLTHTLHSRLEPVNVTTWFWNVLLTSSLLLNERTNARTTPPGFISAPSGPPVLVAFGPIFRVIFVTLGFFVVSWFFFLNMDLKSKNKNLIQQIPTSPGCLASLF